MECGRRAYRPTPCSCPSCPPSRRCWPRPTDAVPEGDGWQFEPKWDGFRCIVFRDGDEIELGSRNERPLTRYFPELVAALLRRAARALRGRRRDRRGHRRRARLRRPPAAHPPGRVAGATGWPPRPRPASSPSTCWPSATTTSWTGRSPSAGPASRRRSPAPAPRCTSPRSPPTATTAEDWFVRFEGAGLDGVMAKALDGPYVPDKRAQLKVKHKRTADCVVAGYRDAQERRRRRIAAARPLRRRRRPPPHRRGHQLHRRPARASSSTRSPPTRPTPWSTTRGATWAEAAGAEAGRRRRARMPGQGHRWNAKKDMSWTPLRPELVAEVAYEHVQSGRFRHATRLRALAPRQGPAARAPSSSSSRSPPYELHQIFGV